MRKLVQEEDKFDLICIFDVRMRWIGFLPVQPFLWRAPSNELLFAWISVQTVREKYVTQVFSHSESAPQCRWLSSCFVIRYVWILDTIANQKFFFHLSSLDSLPCPSKLNVGLIQDAVHQVSTFTIYVKTSPISKDNLPVNGLGLTSNNPAWFFLKCPPGSKIWRMSSPGVGFHYSCQNISQLRYLVQTA